MVLKTRNNNTYSQQPFHKIDFKVHAINMFFFNEEWLFEQTLTLFPRVRCYSVKLVNTDRM